MKLTFSVVGVLALTAGLLAGCTAPPPDSRSSSDSAGKFVACLNAAGQTAKILDGGQVGMLMPEATGDEGTLSPAPPPPGDGPAAAVSVFMDEDGAWMAGGSADVFPEDGGLRAAWAGCEEEVPDFEQPVPDMAGGELEMITREQIIEAGLAFAACARDEGYADFADPDDDGMVTYPTGISEDEFRSLLTSCLPEDGLAPGISQESIESFDFDWMSVMEEFGNGGMVTMGTTSELAE